ALMSEKVSEGIFLEVGGTSTDISVIHNGQVMVNYAEVGGHKTYINSLDIRTVGIAGGSMIRVDGKTIEDVGPRSAHIANLPYILYTPPEELGELEIRLIQPVKGDFSNYCAIYDKTHDKLYALTLAGAANAAGYVEPDHYAFGYVESARRAFGVLAEYMGISLEDVLYQINHKAAKKNISVINRLIKDYNLDAGQIVLVGGGGGAAAVVPFLAEELKMPFKIAKHAEVISPIGVALAMVRDIVERTVINPTDEDIMMIRKEAELQAIKSGASPGTIEVFVEVDGKENKLRAIATGATELKTKNRLIGKVSDDKMLEIAKNSLKSEKVSEVKIAAKTDDYTVIQGMVYTKKLLGLLTEKKTPTRIINSEGVIRAQCPNGIVVTCKAGELLKVAEHYIGKATVYSEGGERLPRTYLLIGPRFVDLSKLISKEQILGLIKIELAGIPETEPVVAVFSTSVTSII
ncbi:MAG: hydantoinase/oxoprolinase family protein, partial [Clostridiaceae bacterium]|nr:hydantoinase/oxoprolinase family protein [Clostridiaceae bacterium]